MQVQLREGYLLQSGFLRGVYNLCMTKFAIIIIVLCAGVGLFFGSSWHDSAPRPSEPTARRSKYRNEAQVVFAERSIAKGSFIKAMDVRGEYLPRWKAPEQAVLDTDIAIGRKAAVDISPRQIILLTDLVIKD